MRLIEQADPPSQATLEISGALDPSRIESMSLSELMRVAEAHGIDWRNSPETPPEALPAPAT